MILIFSECNIRKAYIEIILNLGKKMYEIGIKIVGALDMGENYHGWDINIYFPYKLLFSKLKMGRLEWV